MNRYLISCGLLVLALCVYPCAQGQTNELQQRIKTFRNNKRFEVKYDRFKDETHVSVGPFYPDHKAVGMEAHFFFKGKEPGEPIKDVYFILRAYGRDWRLLNSRTLYGIINGARIEFGEGQRHSNIQLGSVSETLTFIMPMESFAKIASAKSAELKISSIEFALNDEHFAAFRDFLSLAQTTTP
jgi:hypothetical protein